jgi:beta-1,4-mannooligosaccharide/beta-1,4-mannosyl-N-acetylglucosamine phosphorylase
MRVETKVASKALPNIPWEEKPENCNDVVWRSAHNPIIQRDLIPSSNSIFNSAVVPFNGEFYGIFRCDDKRRHMDIHRGKSKDGISWNIDNNPVEFIRSHQDIPAGAYKYDPRICRIEDRYYITWCNDYFGPTIGLAYTDDFKTFHQMENITLPYSRNGVLFPRKINGRFAMLSRPSDKGHTPFGDIFYSESPDLRYWGCHRHVMGTAEGWQSTKVGAGPGPIETTEGWLLIYHGVLNSCNGFVYSAGAALLDIDKPWKVIYRTAPYILAPVEPYECIGDTPNVVFPCSLLIDEPTGRIAIYYGAADTVICLAYTQLDMLIDFVKFNSLA